MNFLSKSKDLMDILMPEMDYIIKKHNFQKHKKSEMLLSLFFNKIKLADKHYTCSTIKNLIKTNIYSVNDKTKLNHTSLHEDTYLNSLFVPEHIKKHILQYTKYHLTYSFPVYDRHIEVSFGIPTPEPNINEYNTYIRMIYLWLHILTSMARKNCSKKLHISIYLTDYEKFKPESVLDIISPIHVNSAITTSCKRTNKILIFRREEWFKVFIHETFHSFGMDFSSMDNTILTNKLKTLFPINSNMNAYEAYSEFWATIFNSMFCSYNMIEKKTNKEDFILYCDLCLSFERLFSLFQCVKILQHLNLRYENLFRKNAINSTMREYFYKENTNVFSYYILKTVLLYNYVDFMDWCFKHNHIYMIRFSQSQTNLSHFFSFIKNNYKDKQMLNAIERIFTFYKKLSNKKCSKVETILLHTMRMSLCEMS